MLCYNEIMNGYSIYKKGYNSTPLEEQECFALVEYMTLKNIKFSHIHQEMYTTSFKQKNKAKRLGVNPGVPDYLICFKDKLLFIEMKRKKGGSVSDAQRGWIEALGAIPNVQAVVCYGFDEAKEVIDGYLSNNV